MSTASLTVSAADDAASSPPHPELPHPKPFPAMGTRWLSWLWMIAAAAPFLAAAARVSMRHFALGADFALSAMATSDAAHGHQLLGPYSRMGWSHPGPSWFYLLAPAYTALGGSSGAFYAAYLLVQAACAALIVAAVGRSRPWAQPLAAAIVLCFGLRLTTIVLVNPWNPFALLLPAILLMVLAARAAAGSLPSLAGSALVGTFMIQTHIGSAPLVAAVCVVAGAAWPFTRTRCGRSGTLAAVAAAAFTLVCWIPPAWQQLTSPPGKGNLAQLAASFTGGSGLQGQEHGWRQAANAVGWLLGVTVYHWPVGDQLIPIDHLPSTGLILLVCQLVGTGLLAAFGWRLRHVPAVALAGVLAAGEAAAFLAAHSLRGDVYDYLILWITVLPAILVYGWADLLLRGVRLRQVTTVAATSMVFVLAFMLGDRMWAITDQLTDEPGVPQIVALLEGHLGSRTDPIMLDIGSTNAWPTATGVAKALEDEGFHVHVASQWVHVFGQSRSLTGAEEVRLLLRDASMPAAGPGESLPPPLGVINAELGRLAVVVTTASPGR